MENSAMLSSPDPTVLSSAKWDEPSPADHPRSCKLKESADSSAGGDETDTGGSLTSNGVNSDEEPDIIKVYLTVEELNNPATSWTCHICNQTVKRQSSYAQHLQSHHGGPLRSVKMLYYCPGGSPSCPYAPSEDNCSYFKKLAYLRQHFKKVHCPKDFICKTCKKSFGAQLYLSRHELICQVVFTCSCGSSFSSLEALMTHARRRRHLFDLQKYQKIIEEAKDRQRRSHDIHKTATPTTHVMSNKQVESTCRLTRTSLKPVPIFPKTGHSARLFLHPVISTIYVDCGTQTVPLLVRKRSATQHSQTETKPTKTTGTITTIPPANQDSKQQKRKSSAHTQTKKLKVSTETQTPVVTKRKRNSKKQITTVTTQTSPEQTELQGVQALKLPSIVQANSSTFQIFESFDEVHSGTQTDPNPFFGYPDNSSQPNPLDIEEHDLRETSNSMSRHRTSETQTSPRRKIRSRNPSQSTMDFNTEEFYFASERGSPDLDYFLETMDSETQTYYFERIDDDILSSS